MTTMTPEPEDNSDEEVVSIEEFAGGDEPSGYAVRDPLADPDRE